MTTQQELLAALRGRFGDSQTAIAKALGISLGRLNNYVRGTRTMDDEAVLACCELLGWNSQKYLGKHRMETAGTSRERAFWKRFANAAALMAMLALPWANPAAADQPQVVDSAGQICIMRSVRAWLRRAFSRLFHGETPHASTLLA